MILDSLTLTGADAWAMFIIYTGIVLALGWKIGRGSAEVAEAEFRGHLTAFAAFMSKFPIVNLEVTEGQRDDADKPR